jgi:sulfoxide reductase heme-binding subunit YedZ
MRRVLARLRHDPVAAGKPPLFVACLLPLAMLAWDIGHGTLGPDPVAQLEHRSGDWALRLLLATLAVTPLRRATGWQPLIRVRRMLGLFAFFYATLHAAVYVAVDLGGFWSQLLGDIARRPYLTVGFGAWLLLVPLALTSTRATMRRLGRHWQRLHRLVYVAAAFAVLHFLWLVKADHREPAIYAVVFALLMLARLPRPRNAARAALQRG